MGYSNDAYGIENVTYRTMKKIYQICKSYTRPLFSISLWIWLVLLAGLIPACSAEPRTYSALETHTLENIHMPIAIQMDNGQLTFSPSQDSRLTITGDVLFEKDLEYQVVSNEKEILIKLLSHHANSSQPPLRVTIDLPPQLQAKIETDRASVSAKGLQGDFEIESTSGNITLEQMTGELTVRSNRGDISVHESSGDISVVGNYGALTLQDVSGDVGVSTIMGKITYSGSIEADDQIRLEADHGSVSVNLKDDSALSFQIRSTSGDVTCLLAGTESTTRTCDGEIGSNGGSLFVRTVSGAITLRSIP